MYGPRFVEVVLFSRYSLVISRSLGAKKLKAAAKLLWGVLGRLVAVRSVLAASLGLFGGCPGLLWGSRRPSGLGVPAKSPVETHKKPTEHQ